MQAESYARSKTFVRTCQVCSRRQFQSKFGAHAGKQHNRIFSLNAHPKTKSSIFRKPLETAHSQMYEQCGPSLACIETMNCQSKNPMGAKGTFSKEVPVQMLNQLLLHMKGFQPCAALMGMPLCLLCGHAVQTMQCCEHAML